VRTLTVLYDGRCGFCSACRRWLEGQRHLVNLEFLAAGSTEARRRFPTLAVAEPEDLVIVSDEGGVYRGAHAWIMCLWALEGYRSWAFRFARPALLPLARSAFEWVSGTRQGLSRWLGLPSDDDVVTALRTGGSCGSDRCDAARGQEKLR
jgi:predicted DCC family thiol-disulfide oxidoreductase YuxK